MALVVGIGDDERGRDERRRRRRGRRACDVNAWGLALGTSAASWRSQSTVFPVPRAEPIYGVTLIGFENLHGLGPLLQGQLDRVVARAQGGQRQIRNEPCLPCRRIGALTGGDRHRQGLARAIQQGARPRGCFSWQHLNMESFGSGEFPAVRSLKGVAGGRSPAEHHGLAGHVPSRCACRCRARCAPFAREQSQLGVQGRRTAVVAWPPLSSAAVSSAAVAAR